MLADADGGAGQRQKGLPRPNKRRRFCLHRLRRRCVACDVAPTVPIVFPFPFPLSFSVSVPSPLAPLSAAIIIATVVAAPPLVRTPSVPTRRRRGVRTRRRRGSSGYQTTVLENHLRELRLSEEVFDCLKALPKPGEGYFNVRARVGAAGRRKGCDIFAGKRGGAATAIAIAGLDERRVILRAFAVAVVTVLSRGTINEAPLQLSGDGGCLLVIPNTAVLHKRPPVGVGGVESGDVRMENGIKLRQWAAAVFEGNVAKTVLSREVDEEVVEFFATLEDAGEVMLAVADKAEYSHDPFLLCTFSSFVLSISGF